MPLGEGRYTDVAERLVLELKADAVVVMVLGGPKGSGFSLAAIQGMEQYVQQSLPDVLDQIAKEIRKSTASG